MDIALTITFLYFFCMLLLFSPSVIFVLYRRSRSKKGHPVPGWVSLIAFTIISEIIIGFIVEALGSRINRDVDIVFYVGYFLITISILSLSMEEYRVLNGSVISFREFKRILNNDDDFQDFKKSLRNDKQGDRILQLEINKRWSRLPFPLRELKTTPTKSDLIKSKIRNSNIFINIKTKVKTYSQELIIAGLFSLLIILVFVGEFAFDSHNSSKSNSYDSAYIYDHQITCDYVLNTSTKKIHRPSCPSVKRISPENYDETDSYSYAIYQGYSPCGNCHPYG